jgi:hypothetical protein
MDLRRIFIVRLGRGRALQLAACLLLTSCSFLANQVDITTANGCIERECNDEHGTARQQCMTRCQREYGP